MRNETLFQFFHWYYPNDGSLWNHVSAEAARLADLGITHVWLPPPYKSAKGIHEAGYAVYDLYDLGEFNQKGTVRTKYGTIQEYLQAIKSLREQRVRVLADIVLNHLEGGDEKEKMEAHVVKQEDREVATTEVTTIEARTRFVFPGRNGKYSSFIWDKNCFTGVCKDDKIYLIHNEHSNGDWEKVPEMEKGNFDFLLGCDIEFRNKSVRTELKEWTRWFVETTGIDAFRVDAIKHVPVDFYPEWIASLKSYFSKDFFLVGEYWKKEVQPILKYLRKVNRIMKLFDAPLHYRFQEASKEGARYDLRTIFDNTLVKKRPEYAVTFVDNHDTQPLQSLESTVEEWFKPIAYSLILLRADGLPCVFYPALYGAKYEDEKEGSWVQVELKRVKGIDQLLKVRKELAYGKQRDYFDDKNVVGWTREGIKDAPAGGCAIVISNSEPAYKDMLVGKEHAGSIFVDCCGGREEKVHLDGRGRGRFFVNARSVSVWVKESTGTKI